MSSTPAPTLRAADEKRDCLRTIATVAIRLRNKDMLAVFYIWNEVASERSRARQALSAATAAVLNQIERRGLNAWLDFYNSRLYNRQVLKRVAGAIQNRMLNIGFITWFDNCYGDTKVRPERSSPEPVVSLEGPSFKEREIDALRSEFEDFKGEEGAFKKKAEEGAADAS